MDLNVILPILIENWPLFFVSAIFWVFGQQVKKLAPDATKSAFWKLFRMTLPLHPVIAGIILGLFPFMPLPATINSLGGIVGSLYYAGAGVLSAYGHTIYRTIVKHKESNITEE